MPIRKINGATVRALREAVGIKHGAFAVECDISAGYLTNVEAGRKQPSPAVSKAIAFRLGVPLDAITYVVEDCAAKPATSPTQIRRHTPAGARGQRRPSPTKAVAA
ncbi:MAG: helix-turn-helix domain-containing protein [Cellulomonadaceae bacterium]|nr:helix-turn-helix domain-containing protein [Cellulomonadaceae bacterium]